MPTKIDAIVNLREALEEITGESCPAMKSIGQLLAFAEITEDEIKRAMEQHPNDKPMQDLLWSQFRLLAPGPSFYDKAPALYRHHCRELLERVARGERLNTGTQAEVLLALVDASLKASLAKDAVILYTSVGLC